ncbi:hypothetical protein HK099_000486 [Clydaea vesicula]|uniref:Uncharacterized protein n=1 Tax=Clydaea vesicula TaxID=447962 RepID=A0AAD5U5U8_9FUNG|nr:hypothetical protein HK099_000486 [Clydaea vesicula]
MASAQFSIGFQTPPFEVIPSSKLIQFDCAIDSTRPYVVWCEYFNKWWSAVTIPKRFTENRLSLQKTQHLIKNEESEILIMFLDKPSFLVSQMEDLKIFNPNDAFFKKVSRSIPKLFEKDYIKNALRLLKKENFTSCNGKLLVKWKEWNLLINELLPELHTVTNLDSITVAHNGNEDISDSVHSAFYEKKNLEIENHFSSTKDCDPTTLEKREEFDKLIIAGDESWEVLSELDELEDGSSMPTAFALKNEVAVNADPIKDSTCYDKINVRKILEVEVSDFNSQYLLNNSKRRKEE